MAVTRLSGGTTPANGSDPRTFPTIWNATADVIEANETAIDSLALTSLSGVSITSPVDNQLLAYNGTNWVNEAIGTDSLSDYEEGSWTPTVSEGTISAASGNYVKIGQMVFVRFAFVAVTSNTSNSLFVQSLPFAPLDDNTSQPSESFINVVGVPLSVSVSWGGVSNHAVIMVWGGGIRFRSATTGGWADLLYNQAPNSSGARLGGSMWYRTAA